ncbi:dihydrofolate reductase family protein [Silvimonas soli]|uniref:dihydrofolate reductase family protein n=1 Tax=Silvimonas soli TaxID=2980100 RepID=UPI0024B3A2D6|nr:dihydrofolate reductase family protein [Silvimonas soli]
MARLLAFFQVSLDGYFADAAGGLDWARPDPHDAEWNDYVSANATGGGMLLFGRVTYELMASYWPTAYALESDPVIAGQMNRLPKLVFSRSLESVAWANTRLAQGDLPSIVRQLKANAGEDMAILGSGSIVLQLAQAGLVDEFQLVVNPVLLGQGRAIFAAMAQPLRLRLTSTRAFGNGNVVLGYAPAT